MIPARLVDALRRAIRRIRGNVSSGYRVIEAAEAVDGWRDRRIADRQHAAWSALIAQMKAGSPRSDLVAAADAVRTTGVENPRIVEIGCGTGYYNEIFRTLFGPVRYTGVDYSAAMIFKAGEAYPGERFVVGDATRLPLADRSCDIAFSGNSLMHIADYAAAIAETARIASRWCVFHSVPVVETRPTTMLTKKAYGVEVFEVIFQRAEIEELFARAGLVVRDVREGTVYDVGAIVGEPSRELTFTCSVE